MSLEGFTEFSEAESMTQHPLPEARPSIHNFETLTLLGEGGYGKVWLVKDKSAPEHIYAMKTLRKSEIRDWKKIQSVKTERDILVAVKHPNVVQLKYTFQSPEKLYFVMEYCRGELFGCREAGVSNFSGK